MGMYISSQNSCDFTAITIIGESEERRTIEGIIRNYYDREDGETTPRFEEYITEGITRRIDYSLIRQKNQRCKVLFKVEDIATYLVEYVKFWDDWEVDRYWNANLGLSSIPVPNLIVGYDDVRLWRYSQGNLKPFSVAYAWDSIRLRADVVDWYHLVWFPHYIPRHAFHLPIRRIHQGRYSVSVPALTKDHTGIKINTSYLERLNTPYSSQYAVFKIWNQYNILEDIKRGPYSKKSPIRRDLDNSTSNVLIPLDSWTSGLLVYKLPLSGCLDTYKSAYGGIQFLCDKLMSWSSKKQDCATMSTAEAEYVSLSACCAQVIGCELNWKIMASTLINYQCIVTQSQS
ncbi:hypothetical protein Tco_1133546 [Tanacetum coccineum]